VSIFFLYLFQSQYGCGVIYSKNGVPRIFGN